WTVFQSRRRAAREARNFVKLTEQEVDDLVDEWTPEPLVPELSQAALTAWSKTPIIVGPASSRPRVTNALIDPSLALTPSNPTLDPSVLANAKTKEVINLASFNFTLAPSSSSSSSSSGSSSVSSASSAVLITSTGASSNSTSSPKGTAEQPLPGTETAINTLRKYGLGSCGPPGFYGTIDVHLELEKNIASFLGTESAIIYSQGFSTASSVIPAFCKRGDVIVADRGVNFVIQKGLQLSRSTIRWYDHNSLRGPSSSSSPASPSSLVGVLEQLEKEFKRKKTPLTRRFIVTEGLFADSGSLTDLPVLLSIAKRFKYRIILDESFSIGTLGRTGRGLTELYNVPAEEVDMIIGSLANTMSSAGGFCAGSKVMCEHQRINSTSFVFSAALPALLATAASETISGFTRHPEMFTALQENVRAVRAILAGMDTLEIVSHSVSPLVHLAIKAPSSATLSPETRSSNSGAGAGAGKSNANSIIPRDAPVYDVQKEEGLLQEVVDEALLQGVLITRAKRLYGDQDDKQVSLFCV
ncbi:serine palmitoyltransferase component, partial [Serendipita sp. 397]